jgi:arylformamidase
MQHQWQDVSIPISPQMTSWPGDPVYEFEPACRIADGASCNVSRIAMATHTGTHCDAPWHFAENGARLDQVDTSLFFGKALVIDLPEVDLIESTHLPAVQLPERVLFRTRNSFLPEDGYFEQNFVALDVSASERLVADGVKLVGIDYLSISPYGNSTPVHKTLLEAGILIIEGLRLATVPAGLHDFVVLPLPLVGADGAPCRAFIYL